MSCGLGSNHRVLAQEVRQTENNFHGRLRLNRALLAHQVFPHRFEVITLTLLQLLQVYALGLDFSLYAMNSFLGVGKLTMRIAS